MSDAALVALIGGGLAFVQAVTLAILGFLFQRLGRVGRDTSATREQVVNDHSTNFREENDSRHEETRRWFWAIWRRQDGQDEKLDRLLRGFLANRTRIESLEDTINPREELQ